MNDLARVEERLRAVLARAKTRADFQRSEQAQDEVLSRYQEAFSPARISQLSEETFRSFLYFENNKHWTGLYRQGSRLTEDMDALREALAVLVDEERPLASRFDEALQKVKGLGKALASAILLVVYPDRYGVWNNTSESALKMLDAWPAFERGATAGEKYEELNRLFLHLAGTLEIDLWTLDWLWWDLVSEQEQGDNSEGFVRPIAEEQRFRLERHLHDFLISNWEHTELGKEWTIHWEPEDEMAGYEYPTSVGRIDILARHKSRPAWLVVELKRDRAADRVIGQLLRYMGWVKRHKAASGEEVQGLIIAPEIDDHLRYILEGIDGCKVALMRYRVEFHLEPVNEPVEQSRS